MANSVQSGRDASTTFLENALYTTPQLTEGAVRLADVAGYPAPNFGDVDHKGDLSFALQQDGRS